MSATSCLILDTRRPKKTNKYPIKLRVTSDRTPQYYQTIFDMRQEDWEKLSATRISDDLQKLRKTLNEIERTAANAIENLFPFDFQDFEKSFIAGHSHFKQRKARTLSPKTESADQFDYSPFFKRFPILEEPVPKSCTLTWGYLNYIKQLLRRERIDSAVAYHCSYVSLKAFKGNSHLSNINVDYLIDYEKQAKKKGISKP